MTINISRMLGWKRGLRESPTKFGFLNRSSLNKSGAISILDSYDTQDYTGSLSASASIGIATAALLQRRARMLQ